MIPSPWPDQNLLSQCLSSPRSLPAFSLNSCPLCTLPPCLPTPSITHHARTALSLDATDATHWRSLSDRPLQMQM